MRDDSESVFFIVRTLKKVKKGVIFLNFKRNLVEMLCRVTN